MLIWLCMTQNVWLGLASPSSQRVELQVYIMGEWNCISSTNRIFVGETTIWTKSSKLLVIWRPEVLSMKCPFVTLAAFITQVAGYQKSKILYGPFLEKLHKKPQKIAIPFCPQNLANSWRVPGGRPEEPLEKRKKTFKYNYIPGPDTFWVPNGSQKGWKNSPSLRVKNWKTRWKVLTVVVC